MTDFKKGYRTKLKKILTGFDPEGSGYDYGSAKKFNIKPDKSGHWPSRVPSTGLILKGKKHKTFGLTEAGEGMAGYKMIKKSGRYFSVKK